MSAEQRDESCDKITGVSSGIGLGMAKVFLSRGHRVFGSVRSRIKADELRRTLGARFEPLVFDVCKQDEIDRAEAAVHELLPNGRLDALINNAGSAEIGPLLHVAPETLTRHLDTLVVGQLRVTQKFFKYLARPERPGRIINISSISGQTANPYFGCYAAAKHALEGLSKTLREEVRRYGVAVIVVAPGNIATELWCKQQADQLEAYRQTDYYDALQQRLVWIHSDAVPGAMSVEEFASALYGIFSETAPAERYTIIKPTKRRGIVALRRAVRVVRR